ncbi:MULTISPECIES: hypothetical protein [Candidatus Ichthyocystis]|uniref:hypothetical protein n=1 Tax=Candidatus Ichthyocystis TaxID=2929841 RepID=UPI000B85D373|nr:MULTISPECIES: hypothetical protein [Ichthyocystis]
MENKPITSNLSDIPALSYELIIDYEDAALMMEEESDTLLEPKSESKGSLLNHPTGKNPISLSSCGIDYQEQPANTSTVDSNTSTKNDCRESLPKTDNSTKKPITEEVEEEKPLSSNSGCLTITYLIIASIIISFAVLHILAALNILQIQGIEQETLNEIISYAQYGVLGMSTVSSISNCSLHVLSFAKKCAKK